MSRKARRKQLTVVPTFSPWPARLLEANHPHRCLHSFLRWNAVATGKEKRQLHKPTVRTRSCMISFFVNRFCQQILKIPQVRPPGSGNPLIFSSLACDIVNGEAALQSIMIHGCLWNWTRQIEMPAGKAVWSENCQLRIYNHTYICRRKCSKFCQAHFRSLLFMSTMCVLTTRPRCLILGKHFSVLPALLLPAFCSAACNTHHDISH